MNLCNNLSENVFYEQQRGTDHVFLLYGRAGFVPALFSIRKYLFFCQRYIEMNPVRANMVKHPGEYNWSSYRVNGQGKKSSLIHQHILYQNLGQTDKERQMSYREFFRHELESEEID